MCFLEQSYMLSKQHNLSNYSKKIHNNNKLSVSLMLMFMPRYTKTNIPTLPSLIIGEKTRITAAHATRLTTGKQRTWFIT